MAVDSEELIKLSEILVKQHMARYDPSHDWYHVDRVRKTALRIAKTIQPIPDLLLVELVALFHDMADAKYTSTTSLPSTLSPIFSLPSFPPSYIISIPMIIPLISWSTEKKLCAANQWDARVEELRKVAGEGREGGEKGEEARKVLECVQDADRLEGSGAFGILRCAAYASATNSPLYVPSLPPRESESTTHQSLLDSSAIQHFHDKLLFLKDRMKTAEGKRLGEKRHETLVRFLKDIEDEYNGDS